MVFHLHTNHTSYIMRVTECGHLEHLYYGKRLEKGCNEEVFAVKHANLNGCAVAYDKEKPAYCMNDIDFEVSGRGTGDFRNPSIELEWEDGSNTVDFVYESYELLDEKPLLNTMPSSYDENGMVKTLKITLKERFRNVKLDLLYTTFPKCDVITRSAILRNEGEAFVKINRFMSAQLDIHGSGYVMTSFHGDWANEMNRKDVIVNAGSFVNASRTGFSSNHANPFVMLFAPGSTETFGEGYACNLIYSGAHLEMAEVGSQRQTRFMTGINPDFFGWTLKENEVFETPEAVLTFSEAGYRQISERMHAFVRNHIVRGEWKRKERPILLNSWEASYFNISERSLLKLAKAGKDVGIELFVMDDGWFGERNNDTSSLGDWTVNTKKLPNGIAGLADKIEKMGMKFGIWVEPEMVNENSNLYREHPEWAVKIPGRSHGEGRHQMILDLTQKEVQDYIIEAMSAVFSAGKISYVKWDMNRNFSDMYSRELSPECQDEFLHRYIIGLYRVLNELVTRFPHILFESCASGGNRVDLGMMCYMPQVWASDNSDAICRCYIQNGVSYGYPQSVVGAHVSACPNHQTLRNTPLETRFAVASMGLLGYECNLAEMKSEELAAIKEQISVYKKYRNTLQYGQMYRVGGKLMGDSGKIGLQDNWNLVEWITVSEDKSQAVMVMVQEAVKPHTSQISLRTHGLDNECTYHLSNRFMKYDIRKFGDLVNMIAPIHIKKDSLLHNTVATFVKLDGEKEDYTVKGEVLNHAGIALSQSFAGTGYGPGTRVYQDFDSRMYFMDVES